jgi:hypothetical protein
VIRATDAPNVGTAKIKFGHGQVIGKFSSRLEELLYETSASGTLRPPD